MISHTHKFVFVHTPKTAGQSLYKNLGGWSRVSPQGFDKGLKKYRHHFTMSEYLEHGYLDSGKFELYFKFGFVRNPYDRILSEFKYAKRIYSKFKKDFKYFVKRPWGNSRRHSTIKQHIRPQYEFLYDADGKCMVDFIGKFENLQQDFNIVCEKIGIPQQQLPHKNASKHKHYTEYYDEETKQIVAEKYAKDIEYFGYEFGE